MTRLDSLLHGKERGHKLISLAPKPLRVTTNSASILLPGRYPAVSRSTIPAAAAVGAPAGAGTLALGGVAAHAARTPLSSTAAAG